LEWGNGTEKGNKGNRQKRYDVITYCGGTSFMTRSVQIMTSGGTGPTLPGGVWECLAVWTTLLQRFLPEELIPLSLEVSGSVHTKQSETIVMGWCTHISFKRAHGSVNVDSSDVLLTTCHVHAYSSLHIFCICT